MLGESTSPQLGSTWFSASYWRMTAISALLTLPFLCAAAVQALMRSDLAMLARAAFGYLPLAALAIAIAAPLTTLLLAGSDEMSRLVASATGTASAHLLRGAGLIAGFATLSRASAFFTFVVSGLTIAGALALWLELIIREAAVYVIVLMLPLAFAAMVWPARRVWAIRALELLVALILSKFAIVAVLTLGGAALNRIGHFGIGAAISGIALLMLAAFAPWALLRLLPLSELASGVASGLRREAAGSATGMTNAVGGALSPTAGYTEDSTGSSYGVPSMMANVDGSPRSDRGDGGSPAADGATVASGGGTAGVPTGNGSGGGAAPARAAPDASDSGGATSANGERSDGAGAGARIAGFDHVFQAADGEHRTLTLGGEDDHAPVYPPNAPREQPPPADDHDPLPEHQPPDGDE